MPHTNDIKIFIKNGRHIQFLTPVKFRKSVNHLSDKLLQLILKLKIKYEKIIIVEINANTTNIFFRPTN